MRWQSFFPAGRVEADNGVLRAARISVRTEVAPCWRVTAQKSRSHNCLLTGGDTTVRGYSYRSIGARTQNNQLYGGRYMGVASVEWQRPITYRGNMTDWENTLFVDAGPWPTAPETWTRAWAWAPACAGAAPWAAAGRPGLGRAIQTTAAALAPGVHFLMPTFNEPTGPGSPPSPTEPARTAAPPPRRRSALRWLGWAVAALLLAIALAGAGLWWWAGQATSLATVLQRAAQWLPAGQSLQSRDVTGSLRSGGRIGWLRWSSPAWWWT